MIRALDLVTRSFYLRISIFPCSSVLVVLLEHEREVQNSFHTFVFIFFLRQVESTQNMIRIVGLSATLPNYLDVAKFLRVNPYLGLFFFDARFRPVPLGQTFIGVKARSVVQQLQDMDTVCFEKVLSNVDDGYQVCR